MGTARSRCGQTGQGPRKDGAGSGDARGAAGTSRRTVPSSSFVVTAPVTHGVRLAFPPGFPAALPRIKPWPHIRGGSTQPPRGHRPGTSSTALSGTGIRDPAQGAGAAPGPCSGTRRCPPPRPTLLVQGGPGRRLHHHKQELWPGGERGPAGKRGGACAHDGMCVSGVSQRPARPGGAAAG